MADIGEEERTIEVLPTTDPVPRRETEPEPAPTREPEKAPA